MTKSKTRPKTRIPPLSISGAPNRPTPCSERLSTLAKEMTLAGAQVLRDDFGFDEYQIKFWIDQTLIRAQHNRESSGR